MFDNNRDVLEEILCTLKQAQATAEANNALLRLVSAEQIASKQLLQQIVDNTHPHRLSIVAAVKFSGEKNMADNILSLNVGQSSQASVLTYLADGTTPSGAAYSAATWTFSDPSATVVLNPDGVTATVTGVAPSTAPVNGSVTFTATDTDGAVSTWVQGFTVTVSAVTPPPPPTQLSQSSAVQFSTPTP